MKLTTDEIALRLGLPFPSQKGIVEFLLTDSRSLEKPETTLFFAIKGAANDGHRYISELYSKGVRNFILQRIPPELKDCRDANFFILPDSVAALQRLTSRRPGDTPPVVAITGSRGKTTLKEWLFQLLGTFEPVSRSPRSFNSQIGVPLSLWQLDPAAETAIIEAGISRPGEMERLAGIISPETVIITNIGPAHSEGFDSDSRKAFEKALLASTPATRRVIYRAEYKEIREALRKAAPQAEHFVWSTSDPEAPLFLRPVTPAEGGPAIDYTYQGTTRRIHIPGLSEADVENAGNALAFLILHGVSPEKIAEGFAGLHHIRTRLNVTEGLNSCSVVHDSYTSDLSSLAPALDFLRRRRMPFQTATLILSDLLHEKGAPEEIYTRVAEMAARAGISRIIGVGEGISSCARLFPESAIFFPDTRTLAASLSAADFNNEAILIKDSPEIPLREISDMLETRIHETVLEVNLDSIVANYNYFRRHIPSGTGIVCMVKASGYGAGSYEIAKTLQDCGAAYLAVAVLDEGIELRRRGISMPIMVMNPKAANYGAMFDHNLEPEIYSPAMLHDVIREARKHGISSYPIHIKLDTGMHRMGFIAEEIPALIDTLRNSPEVATRSIFSHLATADCPDMDDYTMRQLNTFRELTDRIEAALPVPAMRHILNSAGILRFPEFHYDMVRLGIGLYGANTLPPEMEAPLAVVSTLRTPIIAIREWEAGESIGYARKGMLSRKSRIATIPIGYADGMNRHFGNGAVSLLVNGKEAPTVGNICMDACMIDVTGIDCRVGDKVEVFGPSAPLQRLADTLGTIPYEILTSVSPRVKRIYFRE